MFQLGGFDPGAAFSMLTEASANESDPSAPFVGLATGIEVDRLFGSAASSIPIQIPPGRKGLTPDLTLRYSSNAGNGILGIGWDLPLGCIKRNTADGVPFDYSQTSPVYDDARGFILMFRGGTVVLDRCLSPGGNPSTCTAWGTSSEELSLTVTFERSANRWEVVDTSGTRYYYGNFPDATFYTEAWTGVAPGTAAGTFAWYLTGVVDPNDNYIEIEYYLLESHAYPLVVSYGGNLATGLPHHAEIFLDYAVRPDTPVDYRGGFAHRLTRRLVGIWVSTRSAAGSFAAQYVYILGHGTNPDSGRSQLQFVDRHNFPPGSAPPRANFSYTQGGRGFGSPVPLTLSSAPPNSHVAGGLSVATGSVARTLRGFRDFDGDGRPDYLYGPYDPSGSTDLLVYHNRGDGVLEQRAALSQLYGLLGPAVVDPEAGLVDLDGDGLPDVVDHCAGGVVPCYWQWYRNRHHLTPWTVETNPSSWPGVPPDKGVDQARDMDGDGRADLFDCWQVSLPGNCRFYRNTGTGFGFLFNWFQPQYKQNSPAGLRNIEIDMNGDGLIDLVSSRLPSQGGGLWHVWFNTGRGYPSTPTPWPAPPFAGNAHDIEVHGGTGETGETAVLAALRDMNGDGLPDYVDARFSPWCVYLNTGSRFSATCTPWTGTEDLPYISLRAQHAGPLFPVFSDVVDVDGDGIADHVQVVETATNQSFSVRYGLGPRGGLMETQANGLGAVSTVSYVPSTDIETAGSACVGGTQHRAPCLESADCPGGSCVGGAPLASRLPFPTCVVRELTLSSGFSGTGNSFTTEFTFTGGFFDPAGRQFRGFRQSVERRTADGRTVRRRFAAPPFQTSTSPSWLGGGSGRPFKLVLEEVRNSSGTLLAQGTVDWQTPSLGGGRVQVNANRRISRTYSTASGPTKVRTQVFSYDSFNNLTEERVSGDDVSEIITNAVYAAAAPCRSLPTRISTRTGSFVWSEREFTYDSRCNLEMVRARVAPAGQSATSGSLITTLRLEYDESGSSPDAVAARAGLPVRIIDARNNATTLVYTGGLAGDGCSQALFPCRITNALGHETEKKYDVRWGQPKSVTDPNGNTTTLSYDGLGRLRTVTRPLDSLPWREFVYTFGSPGTGTPTPSRVETRLREPNANPGAHRSVFSFFDSLGRPLQQKQFQYVDDVATVVVHGAVEFDAAGRIAKQLAPFNSTTALSVLDPATGSLAGTSFQYDALDRVTRTTHPDATYRTADYAVAGTVTVRDESFHACGDSGGTTSCPGSQTRERRDALGRVVEVESREGSSLKTRTTHVYDALGRVTETRVTDTVTGKMATTTFAYDSLGRRVEMREPDSGPSGDPNPGLWRYAYDNAGNLLWQNDPKVGQHVEFCYDALNRMQRKLVFADDAAFDPGAHATRCSAATPPVSHYSDYLYDNQSIPGCANQTAGRLCQVTDYQGSSATITTSFRYDVRGRMTQETLGRTVEAGGGVRSAEQAVVYSYDLADRLRTVSYPTSAHNGYELVYNGYSEFGELVHVYTAGQSYAGAVTYDRFGRLTGFTDGAEQRHTLGYGAAATNFRLSQIRLNAGSSVRSRMDYGSYDKSGRLTALTDSTPAGIYTSTSPLRNTWSYQYDGFGRLTWAQRGTTTALTYGYDGLGNMTGGNGGSYQYGITARPHWMTNASPWGSVAHDANGALTDVPATDAGPRRSMSFDREGRLEQVNTWDGNTIRYLYDFRGERVARVVNPGTAGEVVSFYYGRWFEVSGGTLVRHIYLGQRLVAESPLAAPPLLTLAWLPGAQESILLARAMSEAVATRPQLYPVLGLTSPVALALAGGMLLLCIGLAVAPGRVRVGCVGYVHRGRVMLVVVLFAASLTPLPLARPAAAGGGPGPSQPPPIYPAYFVHSDHLGSTLRLTCFEQPGCTTGTVARHYRYSPYGEPKAYNASGTVVSLSSPLAEGFIPERLYTGQRWDTLAQLYYYGARFYDPKLATFMSLDPVRQYMNPYAYVGWNPVAFTDPTGMFAGLGSDIGGHFSSLGTTMPIEWSFDFMLETRFGSINPGAAGGFFGAVSSPGSLAGFVAGVLIAAIGLAIVALGLAVGLGLAAIGGLVGAGIAGITGGSMLGGASSAASMVFSHAAQTTQAELLDVAHGLGGTVEGLVRGLFGTLHGLATLNPDTLVAGLYGLFAASVMPRLGGSGGLNHPGPDANPTASSGSKVDNASIVHDVELGGRGPWVSQPYFGWIYNAYLGPGVEPGAYGQAYRALGTVGFGIPGTLLWSFGR